MLQVSKRQEHGIITTLESSFIGLAYERISSFLQRKHETALHKAVNAMNNQANTQCNKLMKLDDTMLMYGIYNAETLEKLIRTVHEIHNTTSSHEKLFAGEHNHSLFRMLYTDVLGIQQYATSSLLYLRIIQDNWCRYLILLVESWRIVIISGTVHWFLLKTSFHPLLWTSSGLTGS